MAKDIDTNVDNEKPIESTVMIGEYEICPFASEKFQYLDLHEGAEILGKVGPVYNCDICGRESTLWAREDTSKPKVRRRIVFLTIDEPIETEDMGKYIDTVWDGTEVVHIFDCGEHPYVSMFNLEKVPL